VVGRLDRRPAADSPDEAEVTREDRADPAMDVSEEPVGVLVPGEAAQIARDL
jgi:hypothetical protein